MMVQGRSANFSMSQNGSANALANQQNSALGGLANMSYQMTSYVPSTYTAASSMVGNK